MSLSRKFIISFLMSIFFITAINIFAFYGFYSSYLQRYLNEKIQSRDKVTLDYINHILEKQTADEIDSIFTDTEIEFFELLEKNNGEIPLNKEKNVNTVVNYLVKSGIATKYIEELIPTDNVGKVIQAIKTSGTPEYHFINSLTFSIVVINVF